PKALLLDASTAFKDCIRDGLRFQSLIERRAYVPPDLRQLDERRQLRTGTTTDGHLALPGVHVGEATQGEHRLAMEVGTVPRPQEGLGELVVGGQWRIWR
ncbi:MAG: hypothetical protein VB080_05710, partial [Propionicimonas sp.]|uniref:hypothetical protein n=1 Tax=Propionicimonas sp. TaxID=1955623 RepID=UPI002B1FE299